MNGGEPMLRGGWIFEGCGKCNRRASGLWNTGRRIGGGRGKGASFFGGLAFFRVFRRVIIGPFRFFCGKYLLCGWELVIFCVS